MQKVDDIKKSDLAGYVCNRKVVLDILEKQSNGESMVSIQERI
jgi:hypothetical protein